MKKAASGDSSIEGLWTHHLPAAQRRPLPPHTRVRSAYTRRLLSWIGMGFCSVWKPFGHGFCLLHRRERCVDLRCFHPYSRSFVQVFVRVLSWNEPFAVRVWSADFSFNLLHSTHSVCNRKQKETQMTFSVKIISLFFWQKDDLV